MLRFIHVSDLHMHAKGSNEGATALLERIRQEYFNDPVSARVTYLLVTGDVVDDGQDDQYGVAAQVLKDFHGHLLVAPGNHDYGVLGNFFEQAAVARFDRVLGPLTPKGAVEYSRKTPVVDVLTDNDKTRVVAIGINSCLMTVSPLDFACGEIGAAQLEALRLDLRQYANDPTIVYLHHRPLKMGIDAPVMRLQDADAFLSLVESGADVVAFGHSGANSEEMRHRGAMQSFVKRGTYMLDANSSVDQRTYFEVVVESDRVQVNWRMSA